MTLLLLRSDRPTLTRHYFHAQLHGAEDADGLKVSSHLLRLTELT